MSTKSSISALSGLALAALFAAGPAFAANTVPGDSTTYPTADTHVVAQSNVTPGPIAAQLIYLGQSRDQAIAYARQKGEQPGIAQAQANPQARTSLETYERVFGLSPTRAARTSKVPASQS